METRLEPLDVIVVPLGCTNATPAVNVMTRPRASTTESPGLIVTLLTTASPADTLGSLVSSTG